MKFGINFPQNEIGSDPIAVRDFAQVAEGAGFDYLSTFEHVLGAHPSRFEGADLGFPSPPYLHEHEFHEPMALFAFLAGLTSRIEFLTGVLVLPQRQTALVAKQAAEVDLLSGGRLTLGVGVGWNFAEYEGLNEDFHTRGQRQEEQIEVLRKLWSEPLVTFEGRWHHLNRVAIAPRPGRLIPIWLGSGTDERLLRRVARLADGWMPGLRLSDETAEILGRLRTYLREAGRDPASFSLQAGVNAGSATEDDSIATAHRWRELGATHLGIRGEGPGVAPMRALEQAARARAVIAEAIQG